MPKSTSPKTKSKYPLSQRKGGQWRKWINGREHYFGKDQDEALAEYLRTKDDLMAGRTPSTNRGAGCSVRYLINHFLDDKESARDLGELTNRSYQDYRKICGLIKKHIGLEKEVDQITVDDLMLFRRKLASGEHRHGRKPAPLAPTSVGNLVQRARVVFNHAYDMQLIGQPVAFGKFKKPGKALVRKAKQAAPIRLFERDEILELIEELEATAASTNRPEERSGRLQLKAMILLGINCGLGNADVGQLQTKHIDLDRCWVDFPRPKTGIGRRCPLWPETVAALEAVLALKKVKTDRLVFRTKYGGSWFKDAATCPLSQAFTKLLKRLGLKKHGVGFYALRHTFQTIGDGGKDRLAVMHIMGHADNTVSAHYAERMDDDRLLEVSELVRAWLYEN